MSTRAIAANRTPMTIPAIVAPLSEIMKCQLVSGETQILKRKGLEGESERERERELKILGIPDVGCSGNSVSPNVHSMKK